MIALLQKLRWSSAPSLRPGEKKECYTSPFPHMVTLAPRRVSSAFLALIFLASFVGLAGVTQTAQSALSSSADDFVQQILTHSRSPAAITVNFQTIAGGAPDAVEAAQNAILNSFRNAGVRVVKPEQALAEVQITFSEDWQNYNWIATIQEGSTSSMVIKKFPRTERAGGSRTPTLTLRKYTVLQQDSPILDFSLDNQNLVLLEPDQISFYVNDSGQWRGRNTLGISRDQPWPRDLRGRLKVKDGRITAYLPGTLCTGSASPPSLDCRPSDDPWQLDEGPLVAFFSPHRNFFSGVLTGSAGGGSVVPFFSGAFWNNHDQRQWAFAGTDGRARLYANDLSAAPAVLNAWGGNMAALNSKCGSGWQLLVTTPSDITQADAIQAMEINGREALPASAPIELSGSVTALWTSARNAESVNAVMLSPATGKYEAFVLTVACN